jgi:hypothetical protein
MSYPETVLLAVTSHGLTKYNDDSKQVITFNVPPDMKIIKLSAVAPGVCNLTEPESLDKTIERIVKKINKPVEFNKLLRDPVSYLEELIVLIKTNEEDTINETINDKSPDFDRKIRDDYFHHRNKSYTIMEYNQNDPIINKDFVRNNRTELNRGAWDFQISALNASEVGKPDLFNEITQRRTYADADTTITLEQIVDFLKGKGVHQIIIIDLSCSNFESETGDELNNREERNLRRNILKSGLNGGKKKYKKTQKHKRKKRKITKKHKGNGRNSGNSRNKKYKRI